ncbi:hypothetical protein FHX09_001297 [Rhizobium sp. BK538]|nr:hypothetical protein [Rhizobium sp. BK060]MBB4167466.1 hypothetical protein [Rhizobium sp. BK538]
MPIAPATIPRFAICRARHQTNPERTVGFDRRSRAEELHRRDAVADFERQLRRPVEADAFGYLADDRGELFG